jgi:hypothetical protein
MTAIEGALAVLHTDATAVAAGEHRALQDAVRHHGKVRRDFKHVAQW